MALMAVGTGCIETGGDDVAEGPPGQLAITAANDGLLESLRSLYETDGTETCITTDLTTQCRDEDSAVDQLLPVYYAAGSPSLVVGFLPERDAGSGYFTFDDGSRVAPDVRGILFAVESNAQIISYSYGETVCADTFGDSQPLPLPLDCVNE